MVTARAAAALLATAVLVAGCGSDGDAAPAEVPMAPQFAPETTVAAPADGGATSTSAASGGAVATTSTAVGASATGPGGSGATTPALRAAVTDPRGDVTPALADAAPGWADLTAADLHTTADGFELRVSLGEAAPAAAPEGRTMNVAAFVDIDGDGGIDYEVWANLAAEGWGGAWYDNRAGAARFVDESGVAVTVEGGALVLRFPASHLGGAMRFRWSVASEWGRYEAIGTVAAARDDAPDGDAPAAFPG